MLINDDEGSGTNNHDAGRLGVLFDIELYLGTVIHPGE